MDDPVFDGPLHLTTEELISSGAWIMCPKLPIRELLSIIPILGYLVLGKIIEEVSGQSYEGFVKENILDKVGATNTLWQETGKI